MSSSSETTIYVGNLPKDVRDKEVEDLFRKYGRIRDVDVKTSSRDVTTHSFAFVRFESSHDARDAIHGRDRYEFYGKRLRVEFPRGAGPRGPGGKPLRDGGGFRADARHQDGRPLRRSKYRVIVEGLPPTGSWQDVKDHLREAGEICYVNVGNGEGIVEFTRKEDMHKAIRKFDDTKLRSHKGETAYIRLKEDSRRRSRSNSRSRSPRRRRSESRSPRRRRRASRSRS